MKLPQSLHQMLRDTLKSVKKPEDIFLLQKLDGNYQGITYKEILEQINAIATFLLNAGYKKGDRIGMIMENCPEYLIFDQALMVIGCVNVSIYPTLPEKDIAYILQDSGSTGVVVGSPFLLKKTLSIADECPDLKQIVIKFDKESAKSDDPRIIELDQIIEEGKSLYAQDADRVESAFQQVGQEDLASLIYTSGTTGVPKGVMLTHMNFLSNTWMAHEIIPQIGPNDRYLSFLPLCHVYERTATYYLATKIGAEIAFAQSIEAISSNLVEAEPTMMTTVPRLLERTKDKVIKNAESQGGLKTKIFWWALGIGEKAREKRESGKGMGPLLSLQYAIADKLVFTKIKAKLGGKMRILVSGGAALPQHVGEFFGNLNIRALEGYGLTETSPLMAVNEYDRQVFGTVGRVVKEIEVGILSTDGNELIAVQSDKTFDPNFETPEGEIIVRGPSVMKGYWNKEQETREVMDSEGWFHTGDVGQFHKGNLKITDRIKNMLVNAYGKNIYPTPVENQYLQSMAIEGIFLIGDKQEYISAIIVPSADEIKERFGKTDSFFEEADPFIRDEDIREWIGSEIRKYSGSLAKYERVKTFAVKRTPFSLEAGEITPTLKTKRKVIESKYADEIEKLYAD